MKIFWAILVGASAVVVPASVGLAEPADVTKTNPMKVYMHYMPWFETPATLGGTNWGYHWRFNNRNPNIVDATGKRQIASHYYPKIGPYASRDADVIEYHLLLMKFSGVDGVMIDWYGVQGTNGDIGNLLTSSNALVDKVDDFGLGFSVVMEDRFSANIDQATANVAYLRDNYFNKPNYMRLGEAQDPLVGVFGPITFQQPAQWTQILAQAGEPVDFVTLWYESGEAGTNADGEYAWIYEEENLDNHLTHQSNFYRLRAPTSARPAALPIPVSTTTTRKAASATSFRLRSRTTTARRSTPCSTWRISTRRGSTSCNWPRSTTSAKARCSSPRSKPASNT